ncbi:unnamed protein product [Paramecium primaurelia]|uniref:FCP1 homology domain-containing protein n=1 Tax=Paramecium primaurelia TaxID=5886 RepID=A0A8S1NNQ2_PARPR|nr:unnamed protein product [Paramecium primaurelia]
MSNNQIIYQQQEEQRSLFSRLCACLQIFKDKKKRGSQNQYHHEIDTPKSSFILGQKKTIVLDLDETLVHSQFQPMDNYDLCLDIVVQSQNFKVFVIVRPGVKQFIDELNNFYDIILWTASLKEYAMPVMDYIDPDKKAIERLFRESCTIIKGGLTKDLNKLGRDLKDIVIVDNSILSFALNSDNGFQIKDFFYDTQDRELEQILPFLVWISQLPDVRPVSLQYQQFINSSPEQLNQRRNGSIVPLDQQKFYSVSRSFTMQREKIKQNSIIKTLTLSKNDEEEFDEIVFKKQINSGVIAKQDQTNDSEKETFEIGN